MSNLASGISTKFANEYIDNYNNRPDLNGAGTDSHAERHSHIKANDDSIALFEYLTGINFTEFNKKYSYVEAKASYKYGRYFDVGIKDVGKLAPGEVTENGKSYVYDQGKGEIQDIKSHYFVVGAAAEYGIQYKYDYENRNRHEISGGWTILNMTWHSEGSIYVGLDLNASVGAGVGGEAGIRTGYKFSYIDWIEKNYPEFYNNYLPNSWK